MKLHRATWAPPLPATRAAPPVSSPRPGSPQNAAGPVRSRALPHDTLDGEARAPGGGREGALRDVRAGPGQASCNGLQLGPRLPPARSAPRKGGPHTCPRVQVQLLLHNAEQQEDSLRELGDRVGTGRAPGRAGRAGLGPRLSPALGGGGLRAWLCRHPHPRMGPTREGPTLGLLGQAGQGWAAAPCPVSLVAGPQNPREQQPPVPHDPRMLERTGSLRSPSRDGD